MKAIKQDIVHRGMYYGIWLWDVDSTESKTKPTFQN